MTTTDQIHPFAAFHDQGEKNAFLEEFTATFPSPGDALRFVEMADPTQDWTQTPKPTFNYEAQDGARYEITYGMENIGRRIVWLEAKSSDGTWVSFYKDFSDRWVRPEATRHAPFAKSWSAFCTYLDTYATQEASLDARKHKEAEEDRQKDLANERAEIERHAEGHISRTYRNCFDGTIPHLITVAGLPYVLHDQTYYEHEYGDDDGDPMVVATYRPERRTPAEVNKRDIEALETVLSQIEEGAHPAVISFGRSSLDGLLLLPEWLKAVRGVLRIKNLNSYDTATTWDYPPFYTEVPIVKALSHSIEYLKVNFQ